MTTAKLIATLGVAGVQLWLDEEGQLRFKAPKGALSPELKQALVNAKQDVIDFLKTIQVKPADRIAPLQRSGNERLVLSFAQQRLWFLDRLDPGNPSLHITAALKITGTLDIALMRRALEFMVARHESLRTTFFYHNGDVSQVVRDAHEWPFSENYDLSALSADEQKKRIHEIVEDEALRSFDLTEGTGQPYRRTRLLRTRLARLTPKNAAQSQHVLFFNMHHIISDGWSTAVMVRELSAVYDAMQRSLQVVLPPLPIQYADYAAWQRQWMQGDGAKAQLAYWKDALANVPVLELPTDFIRPANVTHRGAKIEFAIPDAVTARLHELSRNSGKTLFVVMLAAYQVLLHRYSGQQDFAVGTPVANRTRSEIEPLIGCFINMLSLRATVDGSQRFDDVLQQLHDKVLKAHDNQDLPFEFIVEAVANSRNMAFTPIFQVVFTMMNSALDYHLKISTLDIDVLPIESHTAKYDMQLHINDENGSLSGAIEFNTMLFTRTTIERLATHYVELLDGISVNATLPVAQYNILTRDEMSALLSTVGPAWNATQHDLPAVNSLHALIEQQVERTPDGIAVSYEGKSWTYRELNARANQLAHRLRELGVGPGKLVGVCLERSLDMSLALLAALKAGAAYVPFDPTFPADRLGFMIEDTEAGVMLTASHLVSVLPSLPPHVLCLDRDAAQWSTQPDSNPHADVKPDNLFNVIFTSGSTGKPKGVMVPQIGIINRLLWMQDMYPLNGSDRVLQKTPYSFDVSVWELFWPLLVGAEIVYAKPEGHKDPDYLHDIIQRERISTLHFVPSMLGIFLQNDNASLCTSIKRVFCSGEALQLAHEKRFFEKLPKAELHNLYGPTEASVDVSYYACGPNSPYRSVPIGKPVWNTQLHVLDARLQPVPVGVVGELYIGGIQLAHGYLKRDELTRNTFIDNPHYLEINGASGHPSKKLYKTGDLARYLPDGNIEYIGRIDFQVKVRGLRIELGEIETVLMRHPAVKESIIVVQNLGEGNVIIVAYFVVHDAASVPNSQELRTFLRQDLPEYMLPNVYMLLDEIPLSPNGKANRKALPAPDLSQLARGEYVAPRNETERVIAEVFGEVLGMENIGVDENFFELGGHSLLATALVARIRQAFGIDLALRAVFENPSVAGLAEKLDAGQTLDAVVNNTPDITRVDRDQPLPLSFAQERLWIIDQFQPNSAAYNIPAGMVLHGAIDVDALNHALAEVVARHESLRTRFANDTDGRALQIIDEANFTLRITDLSAQKDALEQARRIFNADASTAFDLRNGPLLRAHLIRTAPNQHVLIVNMHHIISDGWSLSVLQREFSALYDAFRAGRPSPLPALPVQYADFATWQRSWLDNTALQRHLDYWVQKLHGAPALLKLPTDRARPLTQTFNGARHEFKLPTALLTAARRFSTENNATLYATLLATFKLMLSQYAHMDDICVGTPVAGRERAEVRDLIGYFVNTVVVRTQLEGNPTVVELIERVKDASLGAFANQDVPIEKVLDALQLERNLSYPPVAQVGFSFINAPMAQLIDHLGDARIEPLQFETVIAKYDMTLIMVESPDHIDATVEYNTDLFDASTIARMMRHFMHLLEQCLEHADWHINNLSMLTMEELCEATGADPALTEQILPLTPMQSDLYLYQQMRPATRSNQMGYHCELPFALDIERLRTAFQTLADNSTTLRTTIRSNRFGYGEVAYQCIAKPAPITLEYVDLTGQMQSEANIKARIHEFIYRPYKLEAEPPLRYNITKLRDDHYLAMMGMHHSVTDGIGCVVHGQAVTNYYTALAQGVASDALPKIPDNYVDYIFANRAQMDVQAVQDYWRQQYINCDALDFTLKEKSIPASLGKGRGEQVVKTLDIAPEHWRAVEAYCKQQKSSPAHYFRALYGILIKAYCRAENDFAIAEFFAGRDSRAVMMTQGCFFQQTPFIFRGELLTGEARFDELLKYSREFRKDSRKYQAISMSLANKLRPAGRINFMYNYYTFYTRNETMDGHAVSPREHPPYVEQNVQLVVKTLGDHGFLDLYFQDDSFNDLRLLERVVALSQQILDGVTRVSELTLVLPDEREQQLVAWNQTGVTLPDITSVQAMVERQVIATPDAIAVIDDSGSLSYRELNARANRLAHYLRHLGVGTDTRVGVCLSRSRELMVALLGVIKAGGAYVPMDVNYPSERLQYMVRDAHAPVMITQSCMRAQFAGIESVLIVIDDETDTHNASIRSQSENNPANNTEAADLFYIIYTSGSTGRPKGAAVMHRGEINLLNWYVRAFGFNNSGFNNSGFDTGARSLIISASGFDLTQKNLWAPLVSGGAVVLPELPHYDAQSIAGLIAHHKVTSINCAPSAFYGVVEDCTDLAQLASLQYVIFGGEPIRLEKLRRWLDSPHCRAQVVNNYGPTECTDIAAFHRIEQPALYYQGTVPVGKPNDNVQVYIVNEDLQLLPTGAVGELCIGGDGVGRGYLNHDELNLEKFVGNPFGPGQLYRSGDLMRFDTDGQLEFIGRKDFQIKLNGLRIELGEIEHALRQQKGVSDALVTVIEEQLVAYVTADSINIDRSGWNASLANHLPGYMIPHSIVVLTAWPLTPNGKIDRKALPLPDAGRKRPQFVAPRNDTEQTIADILCRVLGLSQVGIHDNFFDLGGHSLAASRAMAQMREAFAMDIPLSVLFELTTIEKLGDYINASKWAQQSAQAPVESEGVRDEGFL